MTTEIEMFLTQEKIEALLGITLTPEQYYEVRNAVFELSSIIIDAS